MNLFINAYDYIKFLERLDHYLKCNLVDVSNDEFKYPIGKLDDILVHFMHYKSFEDAKKNWQNRLKRLDSKNLFIMMSDRDGCNEELIRRFDTLPYENISNIYPFTISRYKVCILYKRI